MSIEPQADSEAEQASLPIDEELRDILYQLRESKASNVRVMPEAIAQIKQAFTDAGYFKPDTGSYAKFADLKLEGTPNYEDKIEALMTGQEWYDRFLKELTVVFPDGLGFGGRKMIEAAKRAAGLGDN